MNLNIAQIKYKLKALKTCKVNYRFIGQAYSIFVANT